MWTSTALQEICRPLPFICSGQNRSSDSFSRNSKPISRKESRVDDAASLYQSRGLNTENEDPEYDLKRKV